MRWRRVDTSWYDAEQRRFRKARKRGHAVEGGPGAIHDLFRDVAAVDLRAFEEVRRGFWVEPLGDGDFRILRLVAMKGMTYCPLYGVSLGYVPVVRPSSTRFHRTPKAAEPDLFESCFVSERAPLVRYFHDASTPATTWWIAPDVAAFWSETRPRALSFWRQTATTEGVLEKALAQAADDTYVSRARKPLMVAAFAAARLRDRPRAEELLGRHLAEPETSDVDRDRLPAALAIVLDRP